MLRRYPDKALAKGAAREDELVASDDYYGQRWRRDPDHRRDRGRGGILLLLRPQSSAAAVRGVAMQSAPIFEIRVRGRRLVSTDRLDEAQWAARAAARAGEGTKIVNQNTGEVIERLPSRGQARSRSPD